MYLREFSAFAQVEAMACRSPIRAHGVIGTDQVAAFFRSSTFPDFQPSATFVLGILLTHLCPLQFYRLGF